MQAAKLGRSVAAVERMESIGGNCTHRGTIPSKALRFAIFQVSNLLSSPLIDSAALSKARSWASLRSSASSVINQQVRMRQTFYDRNDVPVYRGHARLQGPGVVEVEDEIGGKRRLQAGAVVIATGSRPYRPDNIDFDHPRVHDSDSILQPLGFSPRSITIYGAGVIGCEYASIFANLGLKVNLVNTRDQLLAFLDDEITDALGYHLRDQGVVIRHDEEHERVEPLDDGVVLHLRSGKRIKTDVLLWANGRTGNTAGMGLEALGIAVNHRGQIEVDESYRTAVPHVYAVRGATRPAAL